MHSLDKCLNWLWTFSCILYSKFYTFLWKASDLLILWISNYGPLSALNPQYCIFFGVTRDDSFMQICLYVIKRCKKMFRASSNIYQTNAKILDWLFDILFFYDHELKTCYKILPFSGVFSLKGPFRPNLAYFRRHPRRQLHKNMPIGHKKLQENVQSQFTHLSNECKKFGLIIRQTFFSMIMNSKLATKKRFPA